MNLEKSCNIYKKGAIVYHEGNRMNGLFCVNSGIVKLYKTGIEGKEQIIYICTKGEFFGYSALLSEEQYTDSSAALEDSTVGYIPKEIFLKISKSF